MKSFEIFNSINKCRSCSSKQITKIFSLGHQCFGGIFPSSKKQNIPTGPLELIKCKKCQLIQLKHNFNRGKMFGINYGYESGINKSMKNHLKNVVRHSSKIISLKKSDAVVDIGSNDGTLLNFFRNGEQKLYGIDPTINKKFKKNYNKKIHCISRLFDTIAVETLQKKIKKAKIVFSIAMFYDLPNPVKFAQNIKRIIGDDGIWVSEQSYCPFMLKNNSFDTICHEHLEYYTIKSIRYIFEKVGLKIVDIKFNDVNGGSFRTIVSSVNSKLKEFRKLNFYEKREKILLKKYSFGKFIKKIRTIKRNLNYLLRKISLQNKTVYGYGASTKGNVLLQHFNITDKHLPYISEVNKFKFNRYTPLTKIKILDHNTICKKLPDYFLVLPWHFKNNILKKDIHILKKGVKYIFPLPNIRIYTYRKNIVASSKL